MAGSDFWMKPMVLTLVGSLLFGCDKAFDEDESLNVLTVSEESALAPIPQIEQSPYEQALKYIDGVGLTKDLLKAEHFLLQAAEQNEVKAMLKLGDIYRLGLLGTPNLKKAQHWYEKALDLKDPEAQFHVAQLILAKQYQSNNDPILLLKLSADKLNAKAQLELGKQYAQGTNIKQNDNLAFQSILAAAGQGEAEAMYIIGMSFMNEWFSQTENKELGIQFLKKAAEQNYYPAQYALASIFLEHPSIFMDRDQALDYLQKAAEGGEVAAQIRLAKILVDYALPQYDRAALHWALKASEQNNKEALFLLANFYLDGIGTEVNYNKAMEIYLNLSNSNYALADYKLGQMYYQGQGTSKDTSTAGKYFLKAARAGINEAKEWVAIVYKEGDQNLFEVKEWIQFAAEQGEPEGLFLKGINILYGKNDFEQNIEEGINLITMAADQNFIPAQRELGQIFEKGLFGLMNANQAHDWYLKAAQNGDEFSQFNVAKMYFSGEGTTKNLVESYAWSNLSALKGNEEASVLKDEVTNLLDAYQLHQARELSEKYFQTFRKA